MNKVLCKSLIFCIIITAFSFPQNHFNRPPDLQDSPKMHFFFSEINVLPSQNDTWVYNYSFRIPYNHLVFVKDDDVYKAGFSLVIEVTDTLGNFVDRQIKGDKIEVSSYEDTDSDILFYQALITFRLRKGNYSFLPLITDVNSRDELKLQKQHVLGTTDKYKNLLPPVVVNSKTIKCGNHEFPVLSNYEAFVPFNNNSYDLIIPSVDSSITNLKSVIICDEDTVFNGPVTEYNLSGLNFQVCDSQIVINSKGDVIPTKNYMIRNLSPRFSEGNLVFNFFKDGEIKPFVTHYRQCIWFDKPLSLMNPEFAIRMLKYTATDDDISKLLDVKEKFYKKELYKYWKKYDPTPSTQYNEVMSEYYKRVDYTSKHFTSISNKKGFDTDRGKIYIRFGKPKKIERSSNDEGKIVETWFYDKGKKFIFIDKQGTGEFPLQNR
jgi:GWxTD domain-containing protein